MPSTPTIGGVYTPTYINACNSPYSTGAGSQATGQSFPTGLNPWKVVALTFAEAQAQQAPSPSIEQLYEGDYLWAQVDSGATQADVATGKPAFYKIQTASNSVDPILTVTGVTGKSAQNLFAGVFLNPITVGNWGWIFNGAGRVNVLFKSSLTNNSAAIGDVVETTAAASFDDTSATAVTAASIGIALVKPVANGTSPIYMANTYPRIGGGA